LIASVIRSMKQRNDARESATQMWYNNNIN
jgi:hypothetical protein